MASIVSGILVGILQMIGWKKLIIEVLEDMAYLASKKVSNEAAQKVLSRVADALKDVDSKA